MDMRIFNKKSLGKKFEIMLRAGQSKTAEDMHFLLLCCDHPSRAIRYCAAGQLANFKHENVAKRLELLLSDKGEYPSVRARAADSLQEVRLPRSLPVLIDNIADPSPMVRYMVVFALGSIAPRSMLGQLREIMDNDKGRHRRYGDISKIARWSIAEINERMHGASKMNKRR